jgi:hypothetical protein
VNVCLEHAGYGQASGVREVLIDIDIASWINDGELTDLSAAHGVRVLGQPFVLEALEQHAPSLLR